MYEAPNMGLWRGREDSGEASPAPRWHQRIQPLRGESTPGIALLGICSDEGVARNQGRPGARQAPLAIRHALANLAWHLQQPVYDAGNLHCDNGQLEALSEEQATQVAQLLASGHRPLLIGGGHEIAYGSFLGLARYLTDDQQPQSKRQDNKPHGKQIGIINFDAHFDLRQDQRASSGTPFRQIAEHCAAQGLDFNYCCLGVSETANTQALFQRADQLGATYLKDSEITPWRLDAVQAQLQRFLEPLDALYLSIDLDVLPAATAPGVSAPAPRGLSLELLEELITQIKQLAGDRLKLADIAEYNPNFDIDGRTAKVAARLCHLIAS